MMRYLKTSETNQSSLSDQICYDLLPHEDCHDHCRPYFCTNQVKKSDQWACNCKPFQKQEVCCQQWGKGPAIHAPVHFIAKNINKQKNENEPDQRNLVSSQL